MDYRLFIAIDLPETVREELSRLCCSLEKIRWVSEEQFHLTLRFIGRGDGALVRDLCDRLSILETQPFFLSLQGTGCFPPGGDPKILWAGLEQSVPLSKLYRQIQKELVLCGIEREGRKFIPHITLGRLKGEPLLNVGQWLSRTSSFKTEDFEVDSFHLYTSQLYPEGAVHNKLASFLLY